MFNPITGDYIRYGLLVAAALVALALIIILVIMGRKKKKNEDGSSSAKKSRGAHSAGSNPSVPQPKIEDDQNKKGPNTPGM